MRTGDQHACDRVAGVQPRLVLRDRQRVALVAGYLTRQQAQQRGESGDGMAIAGLILGGTGVVLAFFYLVALAAQGSSS
ncbi:MAG: DUF4190 domain-containing protein [Pseudonocardiaceae bacterium]